MIRTTDQWIEDAKALLKILVRQGDCKGNEQIAMDLADNPPRPGWNSVCMIAVDGGRVVLGDSGYALGQLQALREAKDYSSGKDGVRLLSFGLGRALAVLVDSGFGDGGYEVLVRYTKRTHVPAEVRLVFVEEGRDRCDAPGCQFGQLHHRREDGLLLSTSKCERCAGNGLVSV